MMRSEASLPTCECLRSVAGHARSGRSEVPSVQLRSRVVRHGHASGMLPCPGGGWMSRRVTVIPFDPIRRASQALTRLRARRIIMRVAGHTWLQEGDRHEAMWNDRAAWRAAGLGGRTAKRSHSQARPPVCCSPAVAVLVAALGVPASVHLGKPGRRHVFCGVSMDCHRGAGTSGPPMGCDFGCIASAAGPPVPG